MGAEDPLFILYTSGSTGKPKGVLHTTAGYLLYSLLTFKTVFDYRDEDVFWCTADIGWVTGHSYIVYGPLAAGATTLMFEGVPTYPDPGRFWAVVEKYRVNSFYTAPTVLRALMRHGDGWPERYDLSSLRLLGTVGEPINPEVWLWYRRRRSASDRACPSSTRTGRPRPAASSSRRSRARRRSSRARRPCRSSASCPRCSREDGQARRRRRGRLSRASTSRGRACSARVWGDTGQRAHARDVLRALPRSLLHR